MPVEALKQFTWFFKQLWKKKGIKNLQAAQYVMQQMCPKANLRKPARKNMLKTRERRARCRGAYDFEKEELYEELMESRNIHLNLY